MKIKISVWKLASLLFLAGLLASPGASWAKTINTIDGYNTSGEWNGVPPDVTDEDEAGIDNSEAADVEALYVTADQTNMYIRIDTYDDFQICGSGRSAIYYMDIDENSTNGCDDENGHTGDGKYDVRVHYSASMGNNVFVQECDGGTWEFPGTMNNSFSCGEFMEISAPLNDLGITDNTIPILGYLFVNNNSINWGNDETPNTGTFEKEELLIELESFNAYLSEDGAILEWETASEIDNAGFHIWRSDSKDGEYVRITDALIPAQGDSVTGASYAYEDLDAAGTGYSYQLEDIDYSGVSTFHDLTARYVALVPGWNILYGDAFAGLSVSGALSSIAGNYASVWGLTASGWQMNDPDQPAFSDLKIFEAGNDYWLYVTDDCDLALP